MIVSALIGLFMAGIGYIQTKQFAIKDKYSFYYFLALIQLPLLFLFFRVITAKEKKHFHFASVLVKLIMLTGICYLFLLKFVFK